MKRYFDVDCFKEMIKKEMESLIKEKDRALALRVGAMVVFPVVNTIPTADVVEYEVAKKLMVQRDIAIEQLRRQGFEYDKSMEKELLPMKWNKRLKWFWHGIDCYEYNCPNCGLSFESDELDILCCPECQKRLDGMGEEEYREKIETMRKEMVEKT